MVAAGTGKGLGIQSWTINARAATSTGLVAAAF